MSQHLQIVNFYEFMPLGSRERLLELKARLREELVTNKVFGTIILAEEGFNASLCGEPENVERFIHTIEKVLDTKVERKSSFSDRPPFRKHEVRIKPEIVTLKKPVDMSFAKGTHVEPAEWNSLISDPRVLVLDARNDYEFRTGTFRNAVNPKTAKFSELPEFVEQQLDPERHSRIAMFCTGGIRCEKFAPYMKELGFGEVFQLRGGILKYLEEVPVDEQLWDGECFVFDERVRLNQKLGTGEGPDLSQRHSPKDAK